MNYKARIYEALAKFSILFEDPPSKERLMAYVEKLQKYPVEKLVKAFNEMDRETDRFPSLAKILNLVDPQPSENDEAYEMAGEILRCVSEFGSHQASNAKEALGEIAWLSVQRFGGWPELCSLTYDQMGTAKAQLRDTCKSVLKFSRSTPDLAKMQPYQKRGLISLKETFKEVLDKPEVKQLEDK